LDVKTPANTLLQTWFDMGNYGWSLEKITSPKQRFGDPETTLASNTKVQGCSETILASHAKVQSYHF